MFNSSMMNKGSCLLRIQGAYDVLKSAEKRIADYILQNPEDIVNLTIEELAIKSNSGYATINRFCKKLGYKGFKDLKRALNIALMTNQNVENTINGLNITSDTTIEGVCERVYTLASKALEDSFAILDVETVEAVTDKLIKADNICFIGAGASGISARYAYSRFFRIGLNCFNECDTTLYRMKVSLLKEKDVLFAISSSGRTADIVEAAKIAKQNKVTVISLSDFALSPLTKVADHNLYTTSRNAGKFLNIDTPLIGSQITIIDVLYMCCYVRIGKDASEKYAKTKSSADDEKIR